MFVTYCKLNNFILSYFFSLYFVLIGDFLKFLHLNSSVKNIILEEFKAI